MYLISNTLEVNSVDLIPQTAPISGPNFGKRSGGTHPFRYRLHAFASETCDTADTGKEVEILITPNAIKGILQLHHHLINLVDTA